MQDSPSDAYKEKFTIRFELSDLTGEYYQANCDILAELKRALREYDDPKIQVYCLSKLRRAYGRT